MSVIIIRDGSPGSETTCLSDGGFGALANLLPPPGASLSGVTHGG